MIDEDTIMRHLDLMLTSSEPGACIHHLHVIAAPLEAIGPLGVAEAEKLHASIYALAYGPGPDEQDFDAGKRVAESIMLAWKNAYDAHQQVLWAALSQEVWSVPRPDALARRLSREHRISEHPLAGEQTVVYAACRDGRRWTGGRWITGPAAGAVVDLQLLVGAEVPGEGYGYGPLMRRLVSADPTGYGARP